MTRDNIVWVIGFVGAVLLFVVSSTNLLPHDVADKAKDVAAILGFISGYLGGSPLKLSDARRQQYVESGEATVVKAPEPPKAA